MIPFQETSKETQSILAVAEVASRSSLLPFSVSAMFSCIRVRLGFLQAQQLHSEQHAQQQAQHSAIPKQQVVTPLQNEAQISMSHIPERELAEFIQPRQPPPRDWLGLLYTSSESSISGWDTILLCCLKVDVEVRERSRVQMREADAIVAKLQEPG
ncbi:hypothetical protein BCR34DRAFT_570301 [Clohesyomyces aquaticus]|uniref:Uncharacterized protein n=1 Tax=Clohesyomyces aquaticus TaxID=1231657 RepID=A0A1Y1ZCC7_9PLEO|nr:hypothetical protein BCR34DRAFT_570301 [Clohesyomyces aquaticus]